jgi:predicted RNA binding protein YcfA (HicA-like mRNA interferase family)
MIPVIDFSIFSLAEFQRSLRLKSGHTSSLFLYHADHSEWDTLFAKKSSMWTYIQDQFRDYHDAYVPFIPDSEYITRYSSQLRTTLKPVEDRIKSKLIQLGVTDVEDYYKNNSDWMPLLLTEREQLDRGCQLVKEELNLNQSSPLLLVWTDAQSKDLMMITLPDEHLHLEKYYKAIVSALRNATETILQKSRKPNVSQLKNEMNKYLQRNPFFYKRDQPIPTIEVIQLEQSIGKALCEIGTTYGEQYEDAISHYGKYVGENQLPTKYSAELANKIKRFLKNGGFEFIRQGKHEIWKHPNLDKPTPVPRHNQLSPNTIKSIMMDIYMAKNSDKPKSM